MIKFLQKEKTNVINQILQIHVSIVKKGTFYNTVINVHVQCVRIIVR